MVIETTPMGVSPVLAAEGEVMGDFDKVVVVVATKMMI